MIDEDDDGDGEKEGRRYITVVMLVMLMGDPFPKRVVCTG